MRCPTLSELPAAPQGRTGWPWTVESQQFPGTMPDGRPWPRISIVTPSYNQAQFIEETIRSVLLQGYPELEYILIDGGSSEGTVEIIQKYAQFLTYWISEPDRGQTHAINKGLTRCSGMIFNWINSDDVLAPGALKRVATLIAEHDALAGAVVNFGAGPRTTIKNQMLTAAELIATPKFHQPGIWLRREYVVDCGGIDESYHFYFDWDLLVRYFASFPAVFYTDDVLSYFRLHPNSKSGMGQWVEYEQERTQILKKLIATPDLGSIHGKCSLRLRRDAWWRQLREIGDRPHQTNWRKIIDISIGALMDPRVRFDRFTAGAVKALLIRSAQ